MNKINWSTVAALGIIVFLALVIGTSLLGGGWGYGGWGMMGPGMMGGWGFGPFGWMGMIFMWLIPVGFVVLTALGVVWLVRMVGSGMNPTAPTRACPSCRRTVQADWKACPHCGVALV